MLSTFNFMKRGLFQFVLFILVIVSYHNILELMFVVKLNAYTLFFFNFNFLNLMAQISAINLETEQGTNKGTIHGLFINLINSKLTELTVLLIWEIFERLIKTVCVCICACSLLHLAPSGGLPDLIA